MNPSEELNELLRKTELEKKANKEYLQIKRKCNDLQKTLDSLRAKNKEQTDSLAKLRSDFENATIDLIIEEVAVKNMKSEARRMQKAISEMQHNNNCSNKRLLVDTNDFAENFRDWERNCSNDGDKIDAEKEDKEMSRYRMKLQAELTVISKVNAHQKDLMKDVDSYLDDLMNIM